METNQLKALFNQFNILYGERYPNYRLEMEEWHTVAFNKPKHSLLGDYLPEKAQERLRIISPEREAYIHEISFRPIIRNNTSSESASKPIQIRVIKHLDGVKFYATGYKRLISSLNNSYKHLLRGDILAKDFNLS